jgi:hypothetical protein
VEETEDFVRQCLYAAIPLVLFSTLVVAGLH